VEQVLKPRLDVLPVPQRLLWPELVATPPQFTLYGGTAVALHLGHRNSVDFDFFTMENIDADFLLGSIPFLDGAKVQQMAPNTLSCTVDRDGPIKLSFFGVPKLGQIREPHICENHYLRVASLLDLAGTKVSVIQKRAEAKDFIDLDAIFDLTEINLPLALVAASKIYGPSFNPQNALKALTYFEDGNLASVPPIVRERLMKAVQRTDLSELPKLPVG
jgi:hypothetical protein